MTVVATTASDRDTTEVQMSGFLDSEKDTTDVVDIVDGKTDDTRWLLQPSPERSIL